MPTYENVGTATHTVIGTDGRKTKVSPGATIETNAFYTNDDLTLNSDSPFFNRVINRQIITLTGTVQDVEISLLTAWILILHITGTVTIYRQAEENTPPEFLDHTSDDPVIQIPAKGTLDNLSMKGSGTCEVIEYKEMP